LLLTTAPQEFSFPIGDTYDKTIYFKYTGTSTPSTTLYGDKKNTGMTTVGPFYQADGSYSLKLKGIPVKAGKFKMKIVFTDKGGKQNKVEYPFVADIQGLTFATTTLPVAYGVRKEYLAKIYFNNPTKSKPKFSYNFPVEFGKVDTDIEQGKDFVGLLKYILARYSFLTP
jgi:hypothetical protein